jgi:hypothetical protein
MKASSGAISKEMSFHGFCIGLSYLFNSLFMVYVQSCASEITAPNGWVIDGVTEALSRRLPGRTEVKDDRHQVSTAEWPLCLDITQGPFYQQLLWDVPTDARTLCGKTLVFRTS